MPDLPVNTDQVRAYLQREPARTASCASLIRALCAEIDRLRGQLRLAGTPTRPPRGGR